MSCYYNGNYNRNSTTHCCDWSDIARKINCYLRHELEKEVGF